MNGKNLVGRQGLTNKKASKTTLMNLMVTSRNASVVLLSTPTIDAQAVITNPPPSRDKGINKALEKAVP